MTYRPTYKCQIKDLHNIYQSYFGDIQGRFVEVGAFDCYHWSNTYGLAQAGWHGLAIEPNPEFFDGCKKLYANNHNIILEQCCIGRHNGTIKLYLGGSLSTIKRGIIATYNSIPGMDFTGLKDDNFIECPVYTLDTILRKYDYRPNFEVLSIDVEGAELDVLSGFSLEYYQPKMIIIEVHEHHQDKRLSGKARKVDKILRRYEKIYSDHINNIYVRENDY